MAVILLSSCSKEIYYSCNPTIQQEVKKNLPKYSSMTREEWKQLPDSLKKAAYAAMKPEIKRAFWEEKRTELMQLDWLEEKDKAHIALFFSIWEKFPDFFEDNFMENSFNQEYVDNFSAEWNSYAENELGWSYVLRYTVCASGEEVDVPFLGATIMKINGNTELEHAGNGFELKCDCSRKDDWCGSTKLCRQDFSCKKKPRNCGLLWGETCDGMCGKKYPPYEYGDDDSSAIIIGEKYPIVRDRYIIFDDKYIPHLTIIK